MDPNGQRNYRRVGTMKARMKRRDGLKRVSSDMESNWIKGFKPSVKMNISIPFENQHNTYLKHKILKRMKKDRQSNS